MYNEGLPSPLRIGVRRSPMALAFAMLVRDAIARVSPDLSIQIQTHVSAADRILGSLVPYGGKKNFVKDLEWKLLLGEIDLAVHALKDVPGDGPMHEDLTIGAYLPRHDPRDCLVLGAGVAEEDLRQKDGSLVGTSSPRRQAILRGAFPRARSALIRGNLETRLEKLDRGEFDALVLAASGFSLLNLEKRVHRYLPCEEFLPAIGQGILCVQLRCQDVEKYSFLRQITHPDTTCCALAERQILQVLQGNCCSAIAGICTLNHKTRQIRLRSKVFEMQGEGFVSSDMVQDMDLQDPVRLGTEVAQDLLSKGAHHFL